MSLVLVKLVNFLPHQPLISECSLCLVLLQHAPNTLEDKENFIFQEDNAPIHTSRLSNEWKARNNLTSLHWPPQSPDLNPIEHLLLWDVLERKIRAHNPLPKIRRNFGKYCRKNGYE